MATIYVNGKEYNVEDDSKKLIRFLRDDLHLTSVKDGCSEGACGACHVLINDVSAKCCMLPVSNFAGKEITTVEGLSNREKDVFVYAFGKCGAVQCGFCIPGMVISGVSLIRENPSPSRDRVKFAIRNNICRCTGYKKIIDGILLAAKMLRENTPIPDMSELDYTIGSRVPRIDVKDKVLGEGLYPDDIYLDGMLHAVAVRSKYPRAIVEDIDTSKALDFDGVVAVYTADDIPGSVKSGHIVPDWNAMIPKGEKTHFLGDAIALVVATSREVAKKAKLLVKVSYTEMPMVRNPKEASMVGAPLVHDSGNLCAEKHISRGDADEAIKNAPHVLSEHFETPYTEHAFLEPECCVAVPEGEGVRLYTTDQGAYDTRKEVSMILGIYPELVKVENKYVGGGFGGKEDVIIGHLASLAAIKLQKPVKMKLSRAESILIHPKRHPFSMDFTLACDNEGNILGVKAEVIGDTGAYASLCGPVLERACTHAAGPYHYENFSITGKSYYTNNPPCGAFRGFGVTQTCFAIESLLNKMAGEIGISTWEIRYRNAIRPGEVLPNGQIADDSTGLVETLDAIKKYYDENPGAGIACAMKNAGVGVGLPDYGRIILAVNNGKVDIRSGASCIGQGLGTVLTQEVCSVLGCKITDTNYVKANTFNAPDSGTTSGSRQTTVTGEACRRALEDMIKAIPEGGSWKDLEGQEFYGEYLAKTDPLGADKKNPVSHVAYGYATQLAIIDKKTGKVGTIYAAHDIGKAINPTNVEGQIEGGVVMGAGYALTENYPIVDCKPEGKYGTIGLLRSTSAPDVEAILVEKEGLKTSFGAIGVGEITTIPTAPAIANAYYNIDDEFRTSLPISNTPYYKHGQFDFLKK